MPGGKGLCHAGTGDTTMAVAGAEAVAELRLQLMSRAGAWLEVGAGIWRGTCANSAVTQQSTPASPPAALTSTF